MFVFLLATYIKKERKCLIISEIFLFFLYPGTLFTCFLPLFKRKRIMITSKLMSLASWISVIAS